MRTDWNRREHLFTLKCKEGGVTWGEELNSLPCKIDLIMKNIAGQEIEA
jgi:hypothetical protein